MAAGEAVKLSRAHSRATALWGRVLVKEGSAGAEPVSSFRNCIWGLKEELPTEWMHMGRLLSCEVVTTGST
jgi:hypothetical protein